MRENNLREVDEQRLAELERVFNEQRALKQMTVVRWLRRIGAFSLARRIIPRSKDALGSG